MHVFAKCLWKSHWLGIVFFVPVALMLWIHEACDFSWDLLAISDPALPDPKFERSYNLLMGIVFYAGVGAYLIHAIDLAKTGWQWLIVKLIGLAVGWGLLVAAGEFFF